MTAINDLAEEIAAFLNANSKAFPVTVQSINAEPVTYFATETSLLPRVFVNPLTVASTADTRESFREDYVIGITLTRLVEDPNDNSEITVMQHLAETIRKLLKNQDFAAADFMAIGGEAAVPEFDVLQESQGQYYVHAMTIGYSTF